MSAMIGILTYNANQLILGLFYPTGGTQSKGYEQYSIVRFYLFNKNDNFIESILY